MHRAKAIPETAAELKGQGKTQTEIAAILGVDQSTISRALSTEKAQRIIERVQNRYIAAAKGISKRFIRLCHSPEDSIATKNIAEYHKYIGIAPSHAPSIFIDKLYNQTNNTVISQDVIELLAMRDQAIDIGYKTEDS